MTLSFNETLIISNYHRPIPFFTSTIARMMSCSLGNVLIQNTAPEPWAKFPIGDVEILDDNIHRNYFQGMIAFKQRINRKRYPNVKYILLVDNDLFMSDTSFVSAYIDDVSSQGYDYASYYSHPYFFQFEHFFNGTIAPAVPQEMYVESPNKDVIWRSPVHPDLYPWPYWENALLLISMDMWERMSVVDIAHGRKWIAALMREQAKMACIRPTYVTSPDFLNGTNGTRPITHYGPGWFHLGDLMHFYYAVEKQNLNLGRVRKDKFTASRIGFLLYCTKVFGRDCLPISDKLSPFVEYVGGTSVALEAWEDLATGTCMEDRSLWINT